MKDNKSKITIRNPEAILDWAFRYTVNLYSYAVSDVVEEILNNWNDLSDVSKKRYIDEIKKNPNHDSRWNRILEKEI